MLLTSSHVPGASNDPEMTSSHVPGASNDPEMTSSHVPGASNDPEMTSRHVPGASNDLVRAILRDRPLLLEFCVIGHPFLSDPLQIITNTTIHYAVIRYSHLNNSVEDIYL